MPTTPITSRARSYLVYFKPNSEIDPDWDGWMIDGRRSLMLIETDCADYEKRAERTLRQIVRAIEGGDS